MLRLSELIEATGVEAGLNPRKNLGIVRENHGDSCVHLSGMGYPLHDMVHGGCEVGPRVRGAEESDVPCMPTDLNYILLYVRSGGH